MFLVLVFLGTDRVTNEPWATEVGWRLLLAVGALPGMVVLKEVRYVSVPLTLRVCLGSGSRVCRCAVEEVRCGWQQGSDISAATISLVATKGRISLLKGDRAMTH